MLKTFEHPILFKHAVIVNKLEIRFQGLSKFDQKLATLAAECRQDRCPNN
jgi:hypothetical protein